MRTLRLSSSVAAMLAAIVAALPAGTHASSTRPRPNVVLLMTDDQTVRDMRALRQTRQLMAKRGTSFVNSFVSYPLCCPSRATLLTGQYAHNHGVLGNVPPAGGYGALQGKDNTLPVWLQRAGYYTGHIGKYLNGYGVDLPADVPPGWNEWYGAVDPSTYLMWGYTLNENGIFRTYGSRTVEDPALYQTDVYRDKAVDFVRRRAPSKRPFYLSVAFLAPHSEGLRARGSEGSTVRSAPRHRGRFGTEPLPREPAFNESDVSDKPSFFAAAFPPMGPAEIAYAENSNRSRLESLLAVDDAVKAIVSALKATGELDDTLIIFVSDNGFFTGEHRVPLGKYLPYEPSIRVPLMLRGLGVKAAGVSRELVVNTDLAATIVDVARAKAGRTLDGRSLLPFARDPRRRSRRPILVETRGRGANGDLDQDGSSPGLGTGSVPPYRGLRTQRYLYVEYASGERELYDLARDPNELRSRAGSRAYAATRRALDKALDVLATCKGRICRADATRVPPPAK
jgi:N-acetylglucosamine-6-sulfatase